MAIKRTPLVTVELPREEQLGVKRSLVTHFSKPTPIRLCSKLGLLHQHCLKKSLGTHSECDMTCAQRTATDIQYLKRLIATDQEGDLCLCLVQNVFGRGLIHLI